MSTDLVVLDSRMVGPLEQITLQCPDRDGDQAVIIRCPKCGRGVMGRLVRDAAGVHPDGVLDLAHLAGCPVLEQSKRIAS